MTDNIITRLKRKQQENISKNKNADETNARDNELLNDTIKELANLRAQLKKQQALNLQVAQTPLSTTQFFNPSLAKDFYNMDGNSLQTNSYFAVRKMLGIINNQTPGVLQVIPGVNGAGTSGTNPNGTAVGLTGGNRSMSGW